MNKNIRLIFFGTPAFVAPILETLVEHFEVVGVVTAPDKPVGRKQILTPSPIKAFIQNHLLSELHQTISVSTRPGLVETHKARPFLATAGLLTPDKLDQDITQKLTKLQPDLFVVVAYGKIIPQSLLDIPKYGAFNIHYSLLPKYRGASPIQTAILNGEKISGTSIIKMDAKLDHGPIIATKEISLSQKDTFESLNTKMTQETIPLLIQVIPDFISGKIKPVVQDDTKSSYCSLVKKEDGYFDINPPAGGPPSPEKLDRMIRAYYPWPTAWTRWSPSQPQQGTLASPAWRRGWLRRRSLAKGGRSGSDEAKIVKFLPGQMIQMEGKKPVKLEDFLRGYPDFPLTTL